MKAKKKRFHKKESIEIFFDKIQKKIKIQLLKDLN